MRHRTGIALLISLQTLGFALLQGCPDPKPPAPPADPAVRVSSFDEFNKDLATRISKFLGSGDAPDFQVVVTPVSDPIGTLYKKGRSYAFDDAACVPATAPTARSMPNAFPSYQLSGKIVGEFGVDQGVLQGAANAGANLSAASSFSFSIANPQLQVLSDRAIQGVVTNPSCVSAIGSDMVMVRGYVIGRRQFSTSRDRAAGASAGVVTVGNFKIDASNSGSLTVSDDAPQSFLQIISEVVPSTSTAAPPTLAAPGPVSGVGRIYVQQDSSDDPQKGRNLVGALRVAGFHIESRVERTSPARTPNDAQVRYFNESDKAEAGRVLEKLKQQYPDAKLVAVKLPAPPGQLEVWLPRVK